MTNRVALALIACLGLLGCGLFRAQSEVTPETAGAVVSGSGRDGGIQTFKLDTESSVTINPGTLDILERPAHTSVGQSDNAPILGVRVRRAPNSITMTPRSNGEYPEKFFCLDRLGEVIGQP